MRSAGSLDLAGSVAMIRGPFMGENTKGPLNREQKRSLDIEIGFLEGLLRRDPKYVDALQILGDDYTRRGRYEDGLKVDEQLTHLRPGDPLTHYNLACSYALTSRFEEAFAALNLALDHGYRDFRWLAKDPDLNGFRRHALYRRLRVRIKSMQVKID